MQSQAVLFLSHRGQWDSCPLASQGMAGLQATTLTELCGWSLGERHNGPPREGPGAGDPEVWNILTQRGDEYLCPLRVVPSILESASGVSICSCLYAQTPHSPAPVGSSAGVSSHSLS